ncbi:hypothetical protein ACOMHN_043962 [Nucella lapillus]
MNESHPKPYPFPRQELFITELGTALPWTHWEHARTGHSNPRVREESQYPPHVLSFPSGLQITNLRRCHHHSFRASVHLTRQWQVFLQ